MAETASLFDQLFPQAQPAQAWSDRLNFPGLESQHNLPTGLLSAVVRAESAGDPGAVSKAGATGLFQLMPATAQAYGVDARNPQDAAPAAAKELGGLYRKYGQNLPMTLAAWNWGQGNLDSKGLAQAPQETQGFIGKVTNFLSPRSAEAGTRGATGHPDSLFDQLFGGASQAPAAPTPTPVPAPGRATMPSDLVIDIGGPGTPPPPQREGLPLAAPWIPGAMQGAGQPTQAQAPPDAPGRPRVTDAQGNPAPTDAEIDAELQQRFLGYKDLGRVVAPTAINLAGSVGGAAIGTALGGPVGGVAGEMAGGYLANRANQYLGLTPGEPTLAPDLTLWPPSPDVLALGGPLVNRAITAALPAVARRLPGAGAALHQEAGETLERLPGQLAPARPAAELYAEVAAGANPPIASTEMRGAAATVRAQEMALQPTFRNNRVVRLAQDLDDLAARYGGNVPLDQLYRHEQRVGLMIGQAKAENWPQLRALNQLYAGIARDVEAAANAGVPEAQTLRQAMQATRRQFAADDVATMLQPGAGGIQTRTDGLVTINGGKLLDRFQKRFANDELFAGSFTPAERQEIVDLMQGFTTLPRIPAQRGVAVGSSLAIGRGGLAYGLTHFLTGDPAVSGAVAGIAAEAPVLLGHALMTQPGRNFLRGLIQQRQPLTPATLAALRSALQQATSETPEESGTSMPPARSLPAGRESGATR